ncbi:MAG: putative flagellar hook-associated protein 1 FlgK [Pseudomonadota bacterium]|jgi:flagellar hook-associated protein 1 FlgK
MTIGIALQTALTGLRTNQQRTAIIARNIANATTPGFTRKEAVVGSLTVAGEGRGVEVRDIRRTVDAALAREVRAQTSIQAGLAARADALATFTQVVGQPQEERSLSSALAGLERAFLRLEELPESPTQQRAVVDAAVTLAQRLNQTDAKIAEVRQQADGEIGDAVAEVNQALGQLESLNRQVAIRTGTGQDASELEDERDRLLDGIADRMGIHYFTRDAGELVVMTSGGVTLLDGRARRLDFYHTAIIGSDAAYPGSLSGLRVDGVDIAPGSGYPNALSGGRIDGLFAVRDRLMPQAQRQIDEIASHLADRFQAADASIPGTGPADTGLFTDNGARHDRAGSPGAAGMAGRIQVNSLVRGDAGGDPVRVRTGLHSAGGDVGDTGQVRAFLEVFQETVAFAPAAGLMPNGTLRSFTDAAVGQQQVSRATTAEDARAQGVLVETVRATREAREGVNIDEEMQEMIVLERSYAASAQVIQAAARMLDALLEI